MNLPRSQLLKTPPHVVPYCFNRFRLMTSFLINSPLFLEQETPAHLYAWRLCSWLYMGSIITCKIYERLLMIHLIIPISIGTFYQSNVIALLLSVTGFIVTIRNMTITCKVLRQINGMEYQNVYLQRYNRTPRAISWRGNNICATTFERFVLSKF